MRLLHEYLIFDIVLWYLYTCNKAILLFVSVQCLQASSIILSVGTHFTDEKKNRIGTSYIYIYTRDGQLKLLEGRFF